MPPCEVNSHIGQRAAEPMAGSTRMPAAGRFAADDARSPTPITRCSHAFVDCPAARIRDPFESAELDRNQDAAPQPIVDEPADARGRLVSRDLLKVADGPRKIPEAAARYRIVLVDSETRTGLSGCQRFEQAPAFFVAT